MEILKDFLWAFLIGGAWCLIGQFLIDLTKLTPARILVSFVVIGVFLGAIGVYDGIVELGGAGATVPLVGFGYNLAKGIKEAVADNGVIGVLQGGLTAASAGITTVVVAALIVSLCFKRGDKMG